MLYDYQEDEEEDDFYIAPIGYLHLEGQESPRYTLSETMTEREKLPPQKHVTFLTTKLTIISLAYSLFTPSILATPLAFSFSGLFIGVITTFIMLIISIITCHFIRKTLDNHNEAKSFSDICGIVFNDKCRKVVNITFVIYYFGICIMFCVILRQYIHSFLTISFDTRGNIIVYIIIFRLLKFQYGF